ncbi:hypothetical protein CRE_15817 [Caenorhabditis remanei]|uniref:Uncharacterized protein n=1 Tax=Caenorhabditis remanei TaxID=31234 RepID=E3NPX6_CAERE|nr:hypothetical protein CRE_15817 [Caenorhabditis remanei]
MYYSPQFMAPSTKKEFDDWYGKWCHDGFKLHDKLLKYCQSDVRILTLTLMSFIEMCESTFNGWNPIVNGCTIASYVMFVLKHEYIKKGDVGYIPENGYGVGNNSMLALKYIQWLEKKDPTLHMKYKLRGGEVKIEANESSYFADAFNEATRTFLRFFFIFETNPFHLHIHTHRPQGRLTLTTSEMKETFFSKLFQIVSMFM